MSATTPIRLPDLHPLEYEHPFDTKALDALQLIPGVDSVVKLVLKFGTEKLVRIQCTASNLRITATSYPSLYEVMTTACAVLNLPSPPTLYVEPGDEVNACVVGSEQPIVVLTAGAVDKLSHGEQLYIVGHELGHVKSQHGVYRLVADWIARAGLNSLAALPEFGKFMANLATTPLQYAILRWSRMSELTCDRAGLLACQDIDAVMLALMKLAGLPESYRDRGNIEDFVAQAREFETADYDLVGKAMKLAQTSGQTHPFAVVRAAEILKWVESGEYQAVLARQTHRLASVKRLDGIEYCRKCMYRMSGGEKFCPTCGNVIA
ncbi:M48 family metallopeptidase [candidate division WOR-3 bacterium]|uniref:M48 family metallopeptidase n=1 Tax=candidate division WOR-3 bacterium TaxID=2052148 RepID=A0A937XGY8_UNCW3|nr:M48 family metallopeptidase [candidate division WOR-3 bacterium]